MRTTATVPTRPRYGLLDVAALLLRELWLMILVFLVVFTVGAMVALNMPKTYTATASLFVSVGQEYLYQPRAGETPQAQPPELNAVAQSETAILESGELRRRVVQALGAATFNDSGTSGPAAETAAARAIAGSLSVGVSPESGVLALSYKDKNPERAAKVLNAVIDQYMIYRRKVFADTTTPLIEEQRRAFEGDLNEADAAYAQFLASNDIADFEAARTTATTAYQSTVAERLSTEQQIASAERRIASLGQRIAALPPEIILQQDLNLSAQDQLLQARNEREQLLARYQPDAQPVRDVEARIAQLEEWVATGQAIGAKEMRTGPNSMWIELETDRIQTEAERDALIGRRAKLDAQLADLSGRMAKFTELASTNAMLNANREILTADIREFTQRANQSRAANALAQNGGGNIRVIERSAAPSKGSSLKVPVLALAFLFAGFTALCVGLLRVFTRRGFATPSTMRRTLDLPVLAVAPMKNAA